MVSVNNLPVSDLLNHETVKLAIHNARLEAQLQANGYPRQGGPHNNDRAPPHKQSQYNAQPPSHGRPSSGGNACHTPRGYQHEDYNTHVHDTRARWCQQQDDDWSGGRAHAPRHEDSGYTDHQGQRSFSREEEQRRGSGEHSGANHLSHHYESGTSNVEGDGSWNNTTPGSYRDATGYCEHGGYGR